MSDTAQVVTAIGAVITPIIMAWIAYKMKALESASKVIEEKVEIVHKGVNSMKDELVKEVRENSYRAGAKDAVEGHEDHKPAK